MPAMLVTKQYPIIQHNSANKFFDALSSGKPVLLNYSGWQRELLEDHNAGFGCDLCNLDQFVETVLYLNTHRAELPGIGQNARRLAVREFDRDFLAAKALEVVEACKTELETE